MKFYSKSCDGGYAMGCHNLGVMHYIGQGTKKNHPKAKEFFKKACNNGYLDACRY